MIKKTIIILLLLVNGLLLFSQNSIRTHMLNLPQSSFTDVTFWPSYKLAFGLPAISNINLTTRFPFAFYDAITEIKNETAYFSAERLIDRMSKVNALSVQTDIPLIFFGTKTMNDFNVLFANTRMFTEVRIPKEIFSFALEGNAPYEGKYIDLKGFGVDAILYNEIAFGMSTKKDNDTRIGGRIKMLQGIANFRTVNDDIRLYTDTTTYVLTATANYKVNYSGPTIDSDGVHIEGPGDFFSMQNMGLGADAGVYFKLKEKIGLSASITDFGFINWVKNARSYAINNASFQFEGILIDSFNLQGLDSVFIANLTDTLKSLFEPKETMGAYTTWLKTNLFVSLSYEMNDFTRFGASFYSKLGSKSYPAVISIFGSKTFKKFLNLTAAYNFSGWRRQSLGAGLWIKAGPSQWYMSTDNIFTYLQPGYARSANFNFGWNWIFGRQKTNKQNDFRF